MKYIFICFGLISSVAFAGVQIEFVTTHFKGKKTQKRKHRIYSQGVDFRVDVPDFEGTAKGAYLVFLGKQKSSMVVEPSRKIYMEIMQGGKEFQQRLDDQMKQVEKMMEAQLKNMPEAQRKKMRAQMEQMFKQQAKPKKRPKVVYKKMGQDQVGKWKCTKYETVEGGVKTRLCTVPMKSLGLSEADLKPMKMMSDSMPDMFKRQNDIADWDRLRKYGFPVKTEVFKGKKVELVTVVSGVKRVTVPKKLFSPPKSYKRVDPFAVPSGATPQKGAPKKK